MKNPPRNGEGDRPPQAGGGGGPAILLQPIKQVKRARKLRKTMSLPEVLLWQELRKRPGGFKFRRQVPMKPNTLDFACLEKRLVIEVDGKAHDMGGNPQRDDVRDAFLRMKGFETMRIPAVDVLKNLTGVVEAVVARCCAVGPLHLRASRDGPPPRSGEGL